MYLEIMMKLHSSKISSFILLWRILDEQSILLFEPTLYCGNFRKTNNFSIFWTSKLRWLFPKKFPWINNSFAKIEVYLQGQLKAILSSFSKIIKSPVRLNWWTIFELFRSCWFALFVVYRKPSRLGEFLFTVAQLSSWWYKDYRSILKCEHTFIYVDP